MVVEVVEFPHSQQQQGCVLKNEKRKEKQKSKKKNQMISYGSNRCI